MVEQRAGLFTGVPFDVVKRRGRPQEFYNADARQAWYSLARAATLIGKLAAQPGFTPTAERRLRAQLLGDLANRLNRNQHPEAVRQRKEKAAAAAARRRGAKKSNPSGGVVHVLAGYHEDGRTAPACGAELPSHIVQGLRVHRDDSVVADAADADCDACARALRRGSLSLV